MDYPAISIGHWVCLDVLIVYALSRAASLKGLWDEEKPKCEQEATEDNDIMR